MRILGWLFRAFVFFALFGFSLNNQQFATVHWFFGYAWSAPLVIVVLASFGLGAVFGILAMTPGWWYHRKTALKTKALEARSAQTKPVSALRPLSPMPFTDGI
jgi:uncharacterized integral membrane protein